MQSAKQLANEIKRIWGAADAEGRDLAELERAQMIDLTERAQSQFEVEQQVKALSREMGAPIIAPALPIPT